MTIKNALYFSYAGIRSDHMGIFNVQIGNEMLEEPFAAERQIVETSIRGREEPYFHYVKYSPLQFPVSFAFEDKWDDKKIREVTKWLTDQPYYQPLYFTTNIDRIFYALVVESPNLIHNGLNQGYVNLTFRCNSPYSYSPYINKIFKLENNPSEGTMVTIYNNGDLNCYPTIEVDTLNSNSFSILNASTGKKIEFSGLETNELLTIDCKNKDIETNIPLTYRIRNMSNDSIFLWFTTGANRLIIKGQIKIKFTYQYVFLQ